MDTSQFNTHQPPFEGLHAVATGGATCDTFRVKLYGKLHFLKRLKSQFTGDIRYVEAQRKEFETGYRLEHPNIVRYISLTDDGILMEYVDGETLTQCLQSHPDYFRSRHNTAKFLRQLLDAVGYLHAHQVLHLDLKPDNIMLTSIGSDVKLIDLGCCRTDTFDDTQGHTAAFAAPEQLAGGVVDERTDVYAIGRILESLPYHHIYNKVVARCTAERPDDRYQSVLEIVKAVSHQPKPYLTAIVFPLLVALISFGLLFFNHQDDVIPVADKKMADTTSFSVAVAKPDQILPNASADTVPRLAAKTLTAPPSQLSVAPAIDETKKMDHEMNRLLDSVYRSTIATFCDSVFPSQTVGRQWEEQTSAFHTQVLQIAADLSRKYPDIPESVIQQHAESRFQSLVGYVFNRMRENGKQ